MRIVKIEEIASMDNKEIIPSIQGTLTKAFEPKLGEHEEHGKWSVQNAALKDSTGEIKLVVWNHTDIRSFLNREILIKSHIGDKGMTGIVVEDSSWEDKKTGAQRHARNVKVTATADIALLYSFEAGKSGASGAERAATSQKTEGNPITALNQHLMPILNAFYLIERGVKEQTDQAEIDGIKTTPENFGGKCSAAFRAMPPDVIRNLGTEPLWGTKKQLEEDGDSIPF